MNDYSVLEKLEFQKVLNFIANYAVAENGKKYILNLQPLVDLNRITSEGESVNEAKEILIRNIPPQIDFIPDLFETISHSRIEWCRAQFYNQRYQLQNKRNMRFRFNKGHYFEARDQKGRKYPTEWRTLNRAKMFGPRDTGNYGLAESMNYLLFNLVGVPAPSVHTFHFRVLDGVEEAPAGPGGQYNGDFWGMALAIDDYDARFLEAHGMDKGNLYKLKDGETRAFEEERYQAPDAVSHAEDYTNIVMNLHHTKSEAWLTTYVDYDQWYLYETVQQAIRHYDLGMYPEQENRTAPVDTDAGKNLTWYFKPDPGTALGKLWHPPWHDLRPPRKDP